MKYAIASAALLFITVLATPTPLGRLGERDPDTVKNLPDGDKDCNGNTYSSDDMRTAINFAFQAVHDGKQYRMSLLLAGTSQQGSTSGGLWRLLLLANH